MIKKDWQAGIDELEAAVERAKHARADLEECRAIVDELFPEDEDERKALNPSPTPTTTMWGQSIARGKP